MEKRLNYPKPAPERLREPRFVDLAPAEVYATLLDEDAYLCSEHTMYCLLAEHTEVRERRDQLRHPTYAAPELLTCRPNELWSWDITKLLGPAKWTCFYLYVMLDVFSRYVVQIGGPQPLAGKPVAGLLLRDPDLNPCFTHERGGRCRVCAARHALC